MIKKTTAAFMLAALTACNSSSVSLTESAGNDTQAQLDEQPEITTAEPTTCANTAQFGHAFESASGQQSDPLFTPAATLDGCVDSASSWSGNQGETLVLDAGSSQYIQGIYLWMSYARAEWISIEQSDDALTWQQSWRRAQNLAQAESTFFSLDASVTTRYVRITGYGSEANAWTNIAEARWSLSGDNIESDRVWQNSDNLIALHSGDERAVSPLFQRPLSSMFISCPYLGDPMYIDATGSRDTFWQFQEVGDVMVYTFDWSHYPRSSEPDFFGAPLLTYGPARHAQNLLEPLAAADPLVTVPSDCGTGVVLDSLHIIDELLQQSDNSLLPVSNWR